MVLKFVIWGDSKGLWFQNLKEKQRLSFTQFDVVDFYGSISPELLRKSLNFASKYVEISDTEKETILQACLLYTSDAADE